jgi:hypothetical protein
MSQHFDSSFGAIGDFVAGTPLAWCIICCRVGGVEANSMSSAPERAAPANETCR